MLDFGGRVTRLGGNLTIVHIEKQDHGLYECEASNDFTRIVTTTQLIIESKNITSRYKVYANKNISSNLHDLKHCQLF